MSFPSDTKIRHVGVAPALHKQARTWLKGGEREGWPMADRVERCPGNSYQANGRRDPKQEMQAKHKFRETGRLMLSLAWWM